MKMLPIVAGVALVLSVGAAHAGEPLKLTDSQMDGVTAGGLDLKSIKVIKWNFKAKADIKGNFAEADATALAEGKNTLTATWTISQTTKRSSASLSESLSITSH